MAKYKDFDASRAERAAQDGGTGSKLVEPVRFTLRGDEYETKLVVPGSAMLGLAAADGLTGGAQVRALYDFLDAVLTTDSRERFIQALRRDVNPIEITDVGEVTQFIMAELSGRPTGRPTPSPAGPSTTGGPSTAVAWPGT